MIDEDTLRRMVVGSAERAPSPARPLTEVARRADQLRRSRIGTLSVVAAGLAAAVIVTTASGAVRFGQAAAPGERGAQVTPAPPTASTAPAVGAAGCGGGYAWPLTFADIPALLYLPPDSVAGGSPVAPGLARRERDNCPEPHLAALWYSAPGGVVTRRMAVTGPDAAAPGPDPAATFGGTVQVVRLRGVSATVYTTPDAPLWLGAEWTEPGGGRWSADTAGFTRAQALAAIEGLRISGRRLDTGTPPEGLTDAVPLPAGRQPQQVRRYFYASYISVNQDQGGWAIEVSQGGAPAEARYGARAVEVNGTPGWWSGGKGGGAAQDLTWRGPGDIQFRISGTVSMDRALRAARAMVHLRPDDPRLVAIRETAAPSS